MTHAMRANDLEKTRTLAINLQINDKELSPNTLRKPFGKAIPAISNQML